MKTSFLRGAPRGAMAIKSGRCRADNVGAGAVRHNRARSQNPAPAGATQIPR